VCRTWVGESVHRCEGERGPQNRQKPRPFDVASRSGAELRLEAERREHFKCREDLRVARLAALARAETPRADADYGPHAAARARAAATVVLRACDGAVSAFDAATRSRGPRPRDLDGSGGLSNTTTPARAAGAGARVLRDITATNTARPSAVASKKKRTPRSAARPRTPTSSCLM